jgi:predicted Zn-dependent protease
VTAAAGIALELAAAAVEAARTVGVEEADANVHAERSGLARFAASQVHQPTLVDDASVTLRVVRDGRVGCVTTNRTDADGLREAARRAARAADAAPPDDGFPGLPEPHPVPDVAGFDEETASLTPEDQAQLAWSAIEAAPGYGLYGYFTSGVVETAVASTTGLAVSQRATDCTVLAIAADDTRSGYAEAASSSARDLDPAAVAREAAAKAGRTADARPVEPGTYRAVLEPYAFSELLWYFGFTSVSGLALLEGRSYLSGRLGEELFHPSFTLVDDGLDPRGFPKAFDGEGVPREPVVVVEKGVARDVVWDRRTARRAGGDRRSTGHALSPQLQSWGPVPYSLAVEGGDATMDELADRVGDGVWITRLHYLSVVDPREGIITGMTRDGTFLVEEGRVTDPLVNLRFTTSFPELARDLLGLSRETALVSRSDYYDERLAFGTLVPAVATGSFTVVGTGSGPGL